jgi:hypothetical protein
LMRKSLFHTLWLAPGLLVQHLLVSSAPDWFSSPVDGLLRTRLSTRFTPWRGVRENHSLVNRTTFRGSETKDNQLTSSAPYENNRRINYR